MAGGIIFVPWYKADDYYRFRRMQGGTTMPSSYDDWLGRAVREVARLLATGRAVQIVCLTPDTYFEWLTRRCAADTGEERLAYLCDMTARSGCEDSHDTLASSARQAHTHH